MKKYKVGIVPGSFDPITVGHINIVSRAAELCECVYLAVMINSEKEYTFNLSEREAIAETAVADIPNVKVISSEAMLYELAASLSAEVIIKGVRNDIDREYEEKMAAYNAAHYPPAKTLLLDADPTLADMSSTYVRALIKEGRPLDAALPQSAIAVIEKMLKK